MPGMFHTSLKEFLVHKQGQIFSLHFHHNFSGFALFVEIHLQYTARLKHVKEVHCNYFKVLFMKSILHCKLCELHFLWLYYKVYLLLSQRLQIKISSVSDSQVQSISSYVTKRSYTWSLSNKSNKVIYLGANDLFRAKCHL